MYMKISTTLFYIVLICIFSVVNFTNAQVENSCLVLVKNLTTGSKGNDVANLQRFLISKGFNIPALTERSAAAGFFGEETKKAVTEYQRSVSVSSTGFVGPQTRGKIKLSCEAEGGRAMEVPKPSVTSTPVRTSTEEVATKTSTSSVLVLDARSSNIVIDEEPRSTKATFSFQFTLKNSSEEDIFIGNKAGNSVIALVTQGSGISSMTLVSAEPETQMGDTNLAYIIQKGSSRRFVASGRIDNTRGKAGIHTVAILEIPYSISSSLDTLLKVPTQKIPGLKTEFTLEGNTMIPTTTTPRNTTTSSKIKVSPSPVSLISSKESQKASVWQAIKDLFGF